MQENKSADEDDDLFAFILASGQIVYMFKCTGVYCVLKF